MFCKASRAASSIAVVLLTTAAACARTASPSVDAIIAPFLGPGLGGLAVAVVRDGSVLVRKGFGPADMAKGASVATDTVFDLASLSKQFTGMAILLLAQRGRISMQDDIRQYVPEVPVFDRARPIRVDDLSRHRSGLRDFGEGAVRTESDAFAWIQAQTSLEFPTGSRWQYRNVNYFLLGRIVERVSQRSLRSVLEAEVFAPAGMTTAQVRDAPDRTIRNRAVGYCFGRPCGDEGPTGAGGVYASLDDLIAWDKALSRGTLIPSAVLAAQLEGGYALGWGVGEHDGHRIMWHDGDAVGTSAYIARYLDVPLTIIVLSNQTRQPVETIERRLAGAFLPAR